MKKLFALLLAMLMVVSMVACGSKKEDAPTEEPETEVVTPEEEAAPETEEPAPEVEEEAAPETEEPAPEAENGDIVEEPEVEPMDPMMPELSEAGAALLDKLHELTTGTNEDMMMMEGEATEETFEYYTFAPYMEGVTAVYSEPMIGSIAHCVVLMQLPEGADVAAFAETVETNMDPRKWICVEAEEAFVKTSGQYVLLVMSEKATADAIAANFDTVFAG